MTTAPARPASARLALAALAASLCAPAHATDFGASTCAPAKAQAKPQAARKSWKVRGRVKALTKPPKPRSAPYKDAIIAIRLEGVQVLGGKGVPKEILVFAWGMRDNTWTKAARYKAGQQIDLSLVPWDDVVGKYGSYSRIELEGDDIFDLEPFWANSTP